MNSGVLLWGIVVILLVWGIIGGIQTRNIGYTCDMGLTNYLCWKWHKNIIGVFDELVKDVGNQLNPPSNMKGTYSSNLSFDDNSGEFVLKWEDKTNQNPIYRLEVKKFALNGLVVACDINSTQKIGELRCSPTAEGNWNGQSFRIVNGQEIRLDLLWEDLVKNN